MTSATAQENRLALLGGDKAMSLGVADLFTWPIVTPEHEEAVLKVLRAGNMSGLDVTAEFEKAYAKEVGRKYAVACNNGTAAIHSGFYGIGIGVGDEVICPSLTYWASIVQVYSLGATPVFAEVDSETLCLDPADFQRRITPRTKAVVVVHYAGMPADMDAIMPIAKKHNIKVFEDCSHAHAALYKGKEVGTFGDAAGYSLMTQKTFAIGEGGILLTDDQRVYERAILFGQYCKHSKMELADLKKYAGPASGGYKYRMHQLSSAFGLVQLKYYKSQFAEIDKAMHYFCDLIDQIDGIRSVRPAKGGTTTKGGWYFPVAHYDPKKFGGLTVKRFTEAVFAEGASCGPGCNLPLHKHPLFTEMDVYGHHKPTRIANLGDDADIHDYVQDMPITEAVNPTVIALPWFKHYRPEIIKQHADAFKKVAALYQELLAGDTGNQQIGGYSTSFKRK